MLGETVTTDALPATCEVRDWVVFGPGLHKGTLYTPEMCARVPANFAQLAGHLTPTAKLGHDRQQRFAKSFGFLNVGIVTDVKPVGGGNFALTVKNVPTIVGAEINAGRLNGGSVELLPKLPDPRDPAKDIPGPILTGVGFLGEEQPAVKGFAPPRAVFADGTLVPASKDPAPWFEAMAEVMAFAARSGGFDDSTPQFEWLGKTYSATVIAFSEMQMDQKAKLAALGLNPEQIDQVLAICGTGAADPTQTASAGAPANAANPLAQPKPSPMSDDKGGLLGGLMSDNPLDKLTKFADDPNANEQQKLFGSLAKAFSASLKGFSDELADVKKRTGAVEKMSEDAQKKDDEAQTAAFSAHCAPRLEKIARKVAPAIVNGSIKPAIDDIAKSKTFSATTDKYKAVNDLLARYEAMPDDPRLVKPAGAAQPVAAGTTENGRKVIAALKDVAPNSHKRLTAGAA